MRYLSFTQLKAEKSTPWTRGHGDRPKKAGTLLNRVSVDQNTIGWLENEIDGWLAAKATQGFEADTPEAA